jgi:hypothetical protein
MTRTDPARSGGRRGGLVALAAALACAGSSSVPPPRPVAVEPAVAVAAAGAAVTIRGEAFFFAAVQSLDARESRVSGTHRAWAGDTELLDVEWIDESTLRARVPAGVAPGRYDVVVENAFGRGVAPQALELLAGAPGALGAVVTCPEAAAVGQEATLVVEVENLGGGEVRSATPVLGGVDPAVLELVASSEGPRDLAPGSRWPFRWTFRAAAPAELALTVAVTGTDARTGDGVTTGPIGVRLSVRRPAAITAVARVDRRELTVGADLRARLDVTNEGPSPVRGISLAPVVPAFLFLPDGVPQVPELAAGETATVDVRLTAAAAGSGVLAFDVAAEDAAFALPVAAPRATTDAVIARVPATLVAVATATPAQVSTGQDVTVILSVEDRGGTAAIVAPSVTLAGTAVLAETAAPPVTARVEPGGRAELRWTFRAAAPGQVSFAVRVDGEDVVSEAPVAAAATAGPVTVQAPAFVTATAVAAPDPASVGQPVELAVTLTNTGGAAASVGAALTLAGTAAVDVVSAPPPERVRLEPGATLTLRWALAPVASGDAALTAAVAGADVNSDAPLAATARAELRVEAAAQLEAELFASPDPVNDGQAISVRMRVRNRGGAAALDVAPAALALSGAGAARILSGPTPATVAGASPPARVPGGGETWFEWRYEALVPGGVAFAGGAAGRDANALTAVAAPPATAAIRVQRRATLAAGSVSAPARVNVGQTFPVHVAASNGGDATATAVTADVAASAGATASDPPAPVEVAGGASAELTRWFTGSASGTATLSASVTGRDATDERTLGATATPATVAVERPAALAATLALPASISAGEITATMVVTNTGEATTTSVLPGALAVLSASTAQVELLSSPAEPVGLAGGTSAIFTWRLRVTVAGTLQVGATAAGVDANDAGRREVAAESLLAPAARDSARVIATDPFGDGATFAFVSGYGGAVLVGPSRSGTGLARMQADGSSRQAIALAFARDTTGTNTHANSASPYASIGYTGCTPNVAWNACGPDNEDGRGLLTTVTLGGEEWVVLGGAREAGDLDYVYMARGDLMAATFSFVDLSSVLGGNTRGFSAAFAYGGRLYLGFPDNGGNRPYGIAVTTTPTPPGLNAVSGTQAIDLDMQEAFKKAIGSFGNIAMIDTIAELNGRLYFFNNVGCIVSTSATPANKDSFVGCSPSVSAAYDPKGSVVPTRQSDLAPSDRAWPQAAVWKGRLYVIRNTSGPQLWACDPARGVSPAVCDPGDWTLVAGDAAWRTRLGNPGATAASLLVATPKHLYVGLDDPGSGIHVFRTAADAPSNVGDFTGRDGCVAGTIGCEGIGGDGMGDPSTLIRIFDARAIAASDGTTDVYLTAGDGISAPVRVIRVGD